MPGRSINQQKLRIDVGSGKFHYSIYFARVMIFFTSNSGKNKKIGAKE
jgi:hypothetical protein